MSDSNASNPYYDPNSPPSCKYWEWECENLSFWGNPVDKSVACAMVTFCSDPSGVYGAPPGGRPPSLPTPGQTTVPVTSSPPNSEVTTTVSAPPPAQVSTGMSPAAKAAIALLAGGAIYLAYRAAWK